MKRKICCVCAGAVILIDLALVFRESVQPRTAQYGWALPLFLILVLGMAGTTVLTGWLLKRKKQGLDRVFLLIGGVCGLFYLILLPPFTAPDEISHYSTAYYYSNRLMGVEAVDEEGRTMVRKCDKKYNAESHLVPCLKTYDDLFKGLFKKNTSEKMKAYKIRPLNNASWVLYLPQILGITLARILNAGNVPLLLLGRLFALAFYLALTSAAIRRMPFGKPALFVVALLPMSLEMAASLSYDCVINAVSFFFLANSLDLVYRRERVEKKDWIGMAFLVFFVLSGKIVYILMAFLGLLIPKEKFKKPIHRWVYTGVLFAAGLAAVLFSRLGSLTNYLTRETYVATAFETEGYTFRYLITHLDQSVKVFFNTWKENGTEYLATMAGKRLGGMNVVIPERLVWGFLILLPAAAIRPKKEPVFLDGKARLMMAGIFALAASGIIMAMWITWTPLDSGVVTGVQGRYFIPVVLLLLLQARVRSVSWERDMSWEIALGTGILQFFTLLSVLETAYAA